ncbi:MAG: YraN family protein [Patescibacteria group bacterium]
MSELKYSPKRRTGNLGEDIAELFLAGCGYKIIDRNYLKKFGEIDIIVEISDTIRFIEVKSIVTRERNNGDCAIVSRDVSQNSFTKDDFEIKVTQETSEDSDEYLPEDNVTYFKQRKLLRTIETYILEKNLDDNQEWQIDVITVKIDFLNKTATIKHIENVIFEASR